MLSYGQASQLGGSQYFVLLIRTLNRLAGGGVNFQVEVPLLSRIHHPDFLVEAGVNPKRRLCWNCLDVR